MLKARSKPITQERKRRKIGILGTFSEYKTAQSKAQLNKVEESKDEHGNQSKATAQAFGQRQSPNIIGNVEDEEVVRTSGADVQMEGDSFKDLTSSLLKTATLKMTREQQQQQ